MDKGYYEFLVKGKPNMGAKIGKVVFFILAVLFIGVALLLGSMILIVAGIAFGVGAYFVSGYTDVEYEYLYLDKELSVDRVYNKERRKHAETFKMDKVQMFAPEKSSKLDNYGNVSGMKVTDYSCPDEKNGLKRFVMIYEGGRKIFFTLDEEMIKAFKNTTPRNFSDY
ncbi:MAG: DUF6106 family protein [Lachnospiraceae bacterium]|nr:DUF6106 family protein [Lachnospiraceae bacterium]